jgi:hypothetical protein
MSQVEYDVDPKDDEKDDEKFVAIEDDDPKADKDVDSDVDDGDDDDDDEKEESRLGGGREDDAEEKKKSRREENKTRRTRQREARDRTDRELKFLRGRNETLERRFSHLEQEVDQRVTGSEVANVDTAIGKSKSDLQLANQVISQAVEQQDGANLAEALDHRDTIRDQLRDLEQAKEYLSQDRRSGTEMQERLDPRHVAHAQSFMIDHDWWDPRGGDQESQQVLLIDRTLVQEGFDPVSKEYWNELRQRVQTALPNHFDAGGGKDDDEGADDDTGNGKPKDTRNRGPQFRTGGRERPLKKNEVYISPERKDAMVEAGVWDDPVLRNKFLKAYSKYDLEEGATDAR